jgi:hypothetical protein
LRLVGSDESRDWNSRGHFFAAAAEAMRRILVEQARRKHRVRHGGGRRRLSFTGLTSEQTAKALGISLRTANRHWAYARAWLYQQLSEPAPAAE